MSAYERTGWRDKELSNRHREWGFNCPAVDMDFLMVEFNIGKPVAIVEYKYSESTRMPNLQHPMYRAISDLADNYRPKELPFLIVYYWKEPWRFWVSPVNASAKREFGDSPIVMSELCYVLKLHKIRNQQLEKHLYQKLDNTAPDVELRPSFVKRMTATPAQA